jgi:hypothetical protein
VRQFLEDVDESFFANGEEEEGGGAVEKVAEESEGEGEVLVRIDEGDATVVDFLGLVLSGR